MLTAGYETFKFENSLIGAVYPTSPQEEMAEDGAPEGTQMAKRDLMRTVAERGKYFYHYYEYLLTWSLRSFCCCCFKNSAWFDRKTKKLERHEAASEKLADEIDIVKLLHLQRLGLFIAKLVLRKH